MGVNPSSQMAELLGVLVLEDC